MTIYHLTDQGISVCGSQHKWRRLYLHCTICKVRKRFVSQVATGYYSPESQCLGCGNSWEDDFLLSWYDGKLEEAKRRWEEALSPREARRLEDEEYERIIGSQRQR